MRWPVLSWEAWAREMDIKFWSENPKGSDYIWTPRNKLNNNNYMTQSESLPWRNRLCGYGLASVGARMDPMADSLKIW
jgi:hypothetical protein